MPDQAQTITLYDADGTFRGEFEQGAALAEFTVVYGEITTGGIITIDPVATEVDLAFLKFGSFVEISTGNKVDTMMIASKPEQPYLNQGVPYAYNVTLELVSAWGFLFRAVVNPSRGMSRRAPERRPFHPGSTTYDASGWDPVVTAGTKASPGFDRDGEEYPRGWEGPDDVNYIHGQSNASGIAPGVCPLRTTFTLAEPTALEIQMTCDDEVLECWIGEYEPFSAITGRNNWERTFVATLDLPAGTHPVYVLLNNLESLPSPTTSASSLIMYAEDADGNEVFRTDSSWVAHPDYPAVQLPGETFGSIVDTLITEGRTDYAWRNFDEPPLPSTMRTHFTDAVDSAGVPWEFEAPWTFDVRTATVLTAIRELMVGLGVEHITMERYDDGGGNVGFELKAWQTYGVDRFGAGGESAYAIPREAITQASEAYSSPGVNVLYSKTQTGWEYSRQFQAWEANGTIEGGEVVGNFATPEEYNEPGKKAVLEMSDKPRQRIRIIDSPGYTFGVDYDLGDHISIPVPNNIGFVTALDTPQEVIILSYMPVMTESTEYGGDVEGSQVEWELTTRRTTFPVTL